MAYLLAVLMILVLSGCDTEQQPTYDPNTQVVLDKAEYTRLKNVGRFQPFKDLSAVALDTTTGQVCRTSDWHQTLPLCSNVIKANGKPCVIGGTPDYEKAPLCSSLH
jgi:hypothetical protein